MSYELHPAAEAELAGAALYYAREANIRIAQAFLAEFERVAELLVENQRLGTLSRGGLRVFPFRRFPYSLVYREANVGPHVYAVAHQRREPGYWLHRVDNPHSG